MKFKLGLVAFFVVSQALASDFNALLEKHQKLIPFKSSFTQVKVVKEMGIELNSEGTLEVKKGGEAVWQINKPAFFRVETSPSEVKLYSQPNAKPRVIRKDENSVGEGAWIELLMKKPTDLSPYFNVESLSKQKFKLTPKNNKQGFDFLELEFLVNGKIKEVFIQENKEDSLKILFGVK